MKKKLASITAVLLALIFLFSVIGLFPMTIHAQETSIKVAGNVYSFGEKDNYDYTSSSSSEVASATTANGSFTLFGDVQSDGTKNGMPSYSVAGDKVNLVYSYGDALLNADEESWHLVDDKTKKVAGITLNNNIKKGALILQTSKDGETWLNDIMLTNVFAETPVQKDSFYTPNSVQLANGCYFRLIVAYKTSRKVGENKILLVKTDQVEYKKTAEVYEFYLHSDEQSSNDNIKTKTLGSVVNTGKDNGYSGSSAIDIKDPHYGWKIGEFFVSGYTRDTKTSDGTPVFLKNVGDQITLWFNLKQDIDQLNGDSALTISEDTNGYDQFFQTAKTNMGRGALIIRYTDEKGVPHDPEIYINYLAANAKTSADTVVKLFEEGDYEVALDYEIKNDPHKLGKSVEYTNYRIFFKFQVRNGNCMVYPFDVANGSELTDEAITPNGFRLDMAKSRYLNIDVTRAVVTTGANGYVEDIRFNRPAKDGDQYTDEGIYTFSVKNLYTGESTTKRIYVGDTDYMRALSLNRITVTDLNDRITQGGKIEDDGTISMPSAEIEQETPETVIETEPPIEVETQTQDSALAEEIPDKSDKSIPILPIALVVVAVGGVIAVVMIKKKKSNNGGSTQ